VSARSAGILEGRLVRLEPLGLHHVPALVEAAHDRSTFALTWVPDGEAAMRDFVDEALATDDCVPFATHDKNQNKIVGTTRFKTLTRWPTDADRDGPDSVEIGNTWLAPSAQRTGVNREAKLLMLHHAFEVWGVYVVRSYTDVRNERSQRALEKLGMQREGTRRADRPAPDGTIRDAAVYSMTRTDWLQVRDKVRDDLQVRDHIVDALRQRDDV
jgi:RimJ/RimL family protein N-acetyltransferase